jgi:cyclopropane fatty-acyl-phospholipid synthase-like methyltransferase
METSEIKSFYDDFLESKMLKYRIQGNPRIDRATERILQFVDSDSNVLDVGCGIGIVPERIAATLEEGHVWGFDISERNIWYARETVNSPNVSFFVGDVVEGQKQIQEHLAAPIDVIALVDVIEHIPRDRHSDLFQFFESITSEQSSVVLTYPSPQHQKHLIENDPEELQIIDQVIELDELRETAQKAGFSLCHYSLETVWKRNQYIHCVFQTDSSLSPPVSTSRKTLSQRLAWTLKHRWNQYIRIPYRRWKYVSRVFESEN